MHSPLARTSSQPACFENTTRSVTAASTTAASCHIESRKIVIRCHFLMKFIVGAYETYDSSEFLRLLATYGL